MNAVVLPFRAKYAMPGICCACGAPAGNHWLILKTMKMENLVKTDFTLKVPLCASCSKMRNLGIMASIVGGLAGLVVGGVLVAAAASLWNAIETQWLRVGIPIVVVLVFISIGAAINQLMVLKIFYPKAFRLSTRLTSNSVAKILVGDLLMLFCENDAFLKQFQTLNGGIFTPLP